jgi:hypothetical protein
VYFRKMNKKEFVNLGASLRIDDCIRKLRTETAFVVKRTQTDLITARSNEYVRFEELVHKMLSNVGRICVTASQVP